MYDNLHSNATPHSNVHSDPAFVAHSDLNTRCHNYSDSHAYFKSRSDSITNFDPDTNRDAHSYSNPNTGADTNTDTYYYAGCDATNHVCADHS